MSTSVQGLEKAGVSDQAEGLNLALPLCLSVLNPSFLLRVAVLLSWQ